MTNLAKFKKLKLAIVGCGNIANFHVKAFKKAGINFSHCAASLNSKNIKNFASKNKIPNFWNNTIDLINSDHLWDGIVVCSSTESIPEILDLIIKKDKPVLVEKPVSLGTNYLKKFKNKKNTKVLVAYNRRFYPTIEIAKKYVMQSNSQILCNLRLPEQVPNLKKNKNKFRKVFENSSHGIDLLFYLFHNLSIKNNIKLNFNSFDSARLINLKSLNNHQCVVTINSNSPDNFSLELDNGYKRLLLKPFEAYKVYEGIKITQPSKAYPLRTFKPKIIKQGNIFDFDKTYKDIKPGFYEQATNFLNFIIDGNPGISSNLNISYKVQNLLEKIM